MFSQFRGHFCLLASCAQKPGRSTTQRAASYPQPMPKPAPTPRHVHVVGAAIERDGRILCAQRGPGAQAGPWEFPGGKVEPDETPEQALRREIQEELGCDITVGAHVATHTHAYPTITVTLAVYRATLTPPYAAEPTPHEHAALAWLLPHELATKEWAPADIPAVNALAGSENQQPAAYT